MRGENQNNVIKLFKGGEVKTKDGREFTRLLGGFGDDKPMFTIWQAGDLLGLETKALRQNFENNETQFEEKIDFVDLKSASISNASQNVIDITGFLKDVGYNQSKLNATKRWLTFSLSGMLKLIKIAESKESWNIYNDFLEDYFKTKAENMVMEKTLQDELEFLNNQKALTLGKMFMEQDMQKKMDLFNESEAISNRIKNIEVTLSKEQLIEQLQPQLSIAEKFTHANTFYDMGTFAKVLRIKDLGRNNLFEWLRSKEILMNNNQPYQRYMDYFEVLPLENKYTNKINYKTMVRPNGVEYIIKRLIKDGKILTKSVNDILKELETLEIGA